MVDLARQEDLALTGTREACKVAALINAKHHCLNLLFAFPQKLDSKRTPTTDFCSPCFQELTRFRRCTRHKRLFILISYIHKHDGFKPSLRSTLPLASVRMAFSSIHTFAFPLPLMNADI